MENYLKKSPWIDEEHLNFLGVPLGSTMANTKAFLFLLLLSPLSLSSFFFSFLSYGPRDHKPLSSLVWSTKEAIGGIKTPPFLLNRHPFFFIFLKGPVDRTYMSGRPEDQISSFLENSSRHANLFLFCLMWFLIPFSQNFKSFINNNNNIHQIIIITIIFLISNLTPNFV